MKLIIQEKITKSMFGTLNVDYIRNSNLYYWKQKDIVME